MKRRWRQRALLVGVLLVVLFVGVLFVGVGTARGQLSEPDTTETRPQLPSVEPERKARQVTGTQHVRLLRYASAQEGRDRFSAAIPELVDFVSRSVVVPETRFVAGERFFSEPFDDAVLLYLSGDRASLELSPDQRRRLGDYLKAGGLLYAEDVRALPLRWRNDVAQRGTPFDRQFKALMADPLLFAADEGDWQVVPKDHALFSAYFTFTDGPPLSAAARSSTTERVNELEMLEHRGRLAVLFSELNISAAWANPGSVGRRRALQFGANVIVFALAQNAAGGFPGRQPGVAP